MLKIEITDEHKKINVEGNLTEILSDLAGVTFEILDDLSKNEHVPMAKLELIKIYIAGLDSQYNNMKKDNTEKNDLTDEELEKIHSFMKNLFN